MESDLGRKGQVNRHKKTDGRIEAHIVAIACPEAPEDRGRWTLRLTADEPVRLGAAERTSDTAVMETLKKMNLSLGKRRNGASQNQGRSFVARMEDILDVYQRPYDPPRPVVCLDETNRQLIEK